MSGKLSSGLSKVSGVAVLEVAEARGRDFGLGVGDSQYWGSSSVRSDSEVWFRMRNNTICAFVEKSRLTDKESFAVNVHIGTDRTQRALVGDGLKRVELHTISLL